MFSRVACHVCCGWECSFQPEHHYRCGTRRPVRGSGQLSKDELEHTLAELEQLLRRTQAYRWATGIADLKRRLHTERAEVLDYLASAAIWGSSGTLWDLYFCWQNGHISDDF